MKVLQFILIIFKAYFLIGLLSVNLPRVATPVKVIKISNLFLLIFIHVELNRLLLLPLCFEAANSWRIALNICSWIFGWVITFYRLLKFKSEARHIICPILTITGQNRGLVKLVHKYIIRGVFLIIKNLLYSGLRCQFNELLNLSGIYYIFGTNFLFDRVNHEFRFIECRHLSLVILQVKNFVNWVIWWVFYLRDLTCVQVVNAVFDNRVALCYLTYAIVFFDTILLVTFKFLYDQRHVICFNNKAWNITRASIIIKVAFVKLKVQIFWIRWRLCYTHRFISFNAIYVLKFFVTILI